MLNKMKLKIKFNKKEQLNQPMVHWNNNNNNKNNTLFLSWKVYKMIQS